MPETLIGQEPAHRSRSGLVYTTSHDPPEAITPDDVDNDNDPAQKSQTDAESENKPKDTLTSFYEALSVLLSVASVLGINVITKTMKGKYTICPLRSSMAAVSIFVVFICFFFSVGIIFSSDASYQQRVLVLPLFTANCFCFYTYILWLIKSRRLLAFLEKVEACNLRIKLGRKIPASILYSFVYSAIYTAFIYFMIQLPDHLFNFSSRNMEYAMVVPVFFTCFIPNMFDLYIFSFTFVLGVALQEMKKEVRSVKVWSSERTNEIAKGWLSYRKLLDIFNEVFSYMLHVRILLFVVHAITHLFGLTSMRVSLKCAFYFWPMFVSLMENLLRFLAVCQAGQMLRNTHESVVKTVREAQLNLCIILPTKIPENIEEHSRVELNMESVAGVPSEAYLRTRWKAQNGEFQDINSTRDSCFERMEVSTTIDTSFETIEDNKPKSDPFEKMSADGDKHLTSYEDFTSEDLAFLRETCSTEAEEVNKVTEDLSSPEVSGSEVTKGFDPDESSVVKEIVDEENGLNIHEVPEEDIVKDDMEEECAEKSDTLISTTAEVKNCTTDCTATCKVLSESIPATSEVDNSETDGNKDEGNHREQEKNTLDQQAISDENAVVKEAASSLSADATCEDNFIQNMSLMREEIIETIGNCSTKENPDMEDEVIHEKGNANPEKTLLRMAGTDKACLTTADDIISEVTMDEINSLGNGNDVTIAEANSGQFVSKEITTEDENDGSTSKDAASQENCHQRSVRVDEVVTQKQADHITADKDAGSMGILGITEETFSQEMKADIEDCFETRIAATAENSMDMEKLKTAKRSECLEENSFLEKSPKEFCNAEGMNNEEKKDCSNDNSQQVDRETASPLAKEVHAETNDFFVGKCTLTFEREVNNTTDKEVPLEDHESEELPKIKNPETVDGHLKINQSYDNLDDDIEGLETNLNVNDPAVNLKDRLCLQLFLSHLEEFPFYAKVWGAEPLSAATYITCSGIVVTYLLMLLQLQPILGIHRSDGQGYHSFMGIFECLQ